MLDASDMLDAIDARHQPAPHWDGGHCGGCLRLWPCADHLILHPEVTAP
jgi:hypothetical protein